LYADDQRQKTGRDFHVLTIRLKSDLHQTIEQIASRDGETVAAVVRAAIRSAIEQRTAVSR